MKIAILAFAAVAVALPAAPAADANAKQPEAKQPAPKAQPVDRLMDGDIPVNMVTTLKRPNGDVIKILKTRQDAEGLENFEKINPNDLLLTPAFEPTLTERQTVDTDYLERADYLRNKANPILATDPTDDDAPLQKRERKELNDLTTDELQNAAQGIVEDKPVTAGVPLEKRADKALNEMSVEEVQGTVKQVVDDKPVTAGVPLQRRTEHELDELTVDEVMNTSGRVVDDRPVTVGVPEEQRDEVVENLKSTSALN
ncbi:hypothetical protein Q7P37_003903 [Cladosporium fusiforme]